MPVPKLAALAVAACAAASAITSCSGDLATSTTADAVADAGPDADVVRQVSLAMARVNFGDSPTAGAWKQIGLNLDGKVTTAIATDVCVLLGGANPATQDDGQDGVDNSFGENLCPILEDVGGPGMCSTAIPQTYVVTDASGSGSVTILFAGVPRFRLKIPITDAHVVLNGDGSGMLGAVAPTAGMSNALLEAAAAASCGNSQPESVLQEFEQASDILSDGSNSAGQPCDAISIGMQFWDATPFDGGLPDMPDACASD